MPKNLIHVPVVRQRRDFSCGAAATLALLRHWCHQAYASVNEEALYAPLETSDTRGTEPEPMALFLRRNGVAAEYRHGDVTAADLERAVDARQPPIVDLQAWRDGDTPWQETWDAGHYVIMVAYDAERLFFADPSTMSPEGYVYLPRHELDERWHDLAGPEDRQVRKMAIFACGTTPWAPATPAPKEAARLG